MQREKSPHLAMGDAILTCFAFFSCLLVILGVVGILTSGGAPVDAWRLVDVPGAEVTCWRHVTTGDVVCSATTIRGLEC